jgi:hypothetical protein
MKEPAKIKIDIILQPHIPVLLELIGADSEMEAENTKPEAVEEKVLEEDKSVEKQLGEKVPDEIMPVEKGV